jgi:hypothetical protein
MQVTESQIPAAAAEALDITTAVAKALVAMAALV